MAKTDTEKGHLAKQFADILLGIGNRLRIARAITEEYAVRLHRQDLFSRRGCRYNGDSAPLADQVAQDVAFNTEIVSDHFEFRRTMNLLVTLSKIPDAFIPVVSFFTGYFLNQILTDNRWCCLGFSYQTVCIQIDG